MVCLEDGSVANMLITSSDRRGQRAEMEPMQMEAFAVAVAVAVAVAAGVAAGVAAVGAASAGLPQ